LSAARARHLGIRTEVLTRCDNDEPAAVNTASDVRELGALETA
jgi:hypothetical protein